MNLDPRTEADGEKPERAYNVQRWQLVLLAVCLIALSAVL